MPKVIHEPINDRELRNFTVESPAHKDQECEYCGEEDVDLNDQDVCKDCAKFDELRWGECNYCGEEGPRNAAGFCYDHVYCIECEEVEVDWDDCHTCQDCQQELLKGDMDWD